MIEDKTLFAFENDFVSTLRCIPMAVRFKLDACGVKLSLRQWARFTHEQRRACLLQACGAPDEIAIYRECLERLIADKKGDSAKSLPAGSTVPWHEEDKTPAAIKEFAATVGSTPPSDKAWKALTPLKRFVLLKLSRDNHDNINFIPALREFGLYAPA